MKTLDLQISYDSKLNNATYDALKAFQLNTINNTASDLANSKLQDIEASVNTFFNSISSNFNMAGYNQDALKYYVPALVYTMYDGYYIYSPYTNTLSPNETNVNATYQNGGDPIYGLKPYIHYSCRYKRNDDFDVVITYSLDNYITVQGMITNLITGKQEYVYKYGYLLDNIDTSSDVKYRGNSIESEKLSEFNKPDSPEEPYVKINGQKYYYEGTATGGQWYSFLNGEEYKQGTNYTGANKAARQYYIEAKEFEKWITTETNLGELNAKDAVDEKGQQLKEYDDEGNVIGPKFGGYKIFEFAGNDAYNYDTKKSIEDPTSNFNQHRLAVIRYAIEKNLSIAIANYNNYTGDSAQKVNFQMPKLKEDEWTKIINNVSIISFLQGLNIGGKVYNGYSIITNTETQEVVNEESIYLINNTDNTDNNYYRIIDTKFTENDFDKTESYEGVLNTDFRRRTYIDNSGTDKYFFPKKQLGSYTSIVNQPALNEKDVENIYAYVDKNLPGNIKKAYYTALARERYSMYRTNNDVDSDEMEQAYPRY